MSSPDSVAHPWGIPDGAKFAILAVKTSSLPDRRDGMVELDGVVRVLFRTPIPAPDLLNRWFGSLRAGQFEESNLVVVASEQAESPGVFDGQTIRLEGRVKEVLVGALLQGGPFGFRGGVLLSGELRGGELEVRQVTNVERISRVAGSKAFRLSDAMIRDAGRVATALRDRVMADGFRRFRAGFASWHAAVLEGFPGERLHGFVRSLDGVMILPKLGGRRTFRRRGQLLLGRSSLNEQLLDEIYELRNTISHLNDFEDALIAYPQEGRNVTALLRSFQAELLATEVYRRILSSDELLEKMRDDDAIKELWELDESAVHRLWGPPIDLGGPCRARFTDVNTRVFPEARLITRTSEGSEATRNAPAHNPRTGA